MIISRNPFARSELHREELRQGANRPPSYDNCGNHNARGNLFAYSRESDGGGKDHIRGLFCSKACMEAYHGA